MLERAGVLLYANNYSNGSLLQVENVTFQYATGVDDNSASVYLDKVQGSFHLCRWQHNRARRAGGLAVGSRAFIHESQFINNSCWNGAGDVYFQRGSSANDTLHISSCGFTASSLMAAAISISSALQTSRVSDCVFSQSLTDSGSIIMVAHSSGSLLLSNLTFSNIHAPSTLLIQVSGPTTESLSANTSIEGLHVSTAPSIRELSWIWAKLTCKYAMLASQATRESFCGSKQAFSATTGQILRVTSALHCASSALGL